LNPFITATRARAPETSWRREDGGIEDADLDLRRGNDDGHEAPFRTRDRRCFFGAPDRSRPFGRIEHAERCRHGCSIRGPHRQILCEHRRDQLAERRWHLAPQFAYVGRLFQ